MGILSGFKKFKRYIRTGDNYILDSEWTHAETVEMSDGSTLDDTIESINEEISAAKKYAEEEIDEIKEDVQKEIDEKLSMIGENYTNIKIISRDTIGFNKDDGASSLRTIHYGASIILPPGKYIVVGQCFCGIKGLLYPLNEDYLNMTAKLSMFFRGKINETSILNYDEKNFIVRRDNNNNYAESTEIITLSKECDLTICIYVNNDVGDVRTKIEAIKIA